MSNILPIEYIGRLDQSRRSHSARRWPVLHCLPCHTTAQSPGIGMVCLHRRFGRPIREKRLKTRAGMSSPATFQNHLTDDFHTRILINTHFFLWRRPDRGINATPGAAAPDRIAVRSSLEFPQLEYGDRFESNSHEQSYRRTSGRLAHRLRRQRHVPARDNGLIARYYDGMLCRLVVHHRLQRRRNGELQRG
jgi:hypothetical protein